MTDSVARVRPGDLIRAEDINTMLDQITDLVLRVKALEDGNGGDPNAPRIISIAPDPPTVGDELRIVGTNFQLSTGSARVQFDSLAVTSFKFGSTDSLLIVTVPELAGIPDTGRPVTLRVSNRTATATRSITVLPRQGGPAGDVQMSYDGPAAETPSPDPGKQFLMAFKLISRLTVPVTLAVSGIVSIPDWQGGVRILNADRQPVPSAQFPLTSNTELRFYVAVDVPAGTSGTKFTFAAKAEGGGQVTVQGPLPFTVGTAAPPQNQHIDFPIAGVTGGTQSGNLITVPQGQSATIFVDAVFTQTGRYTITVPSPPNWTVTTSLPSTGQYVIEPGDFTSDGKAHKRITIRATAPAATGASTAMTITGAEEGNALKKDSVLQLQSV